MFELVTVANGRRFGWLRCEDCETPVGALEHGESADDALRALELHICPPEGD